MRTPNTTAILAARDLYVRYRGREHRRIESEMRAMGFASFTRRVLYDTRQNGQVTRIGWIRRYAFEAIRSEDTPVLMSAKHEDENRLAASSDGDKSVPAPSAKHEGHKHEDHLAASGDGDKSVPAPSAPPPPPPDFRSWLKRVSPNLTWDWEYQKLIYDKLQQITDGECKRLMIFLPPRHGKSELVTVRYSAWRLQQDPSLNVIIGSYNQRLANKFSRRVRDVLSEPPASAGGLNSPTVHALDQDEQRSTGMQGIKGITRSSSSPSSLSDTSSSSAVNTTFRQTRLNSAAEWETGSGGGVRAVGVGGGITGFGAKLVIIDDPIKSRAEAESKTYRERIWDWFNDDLYTRLEPNAAIILIQTRWHEDDLSGRLIKQMQHDGGEHWDVISLPALAERIENGELRIENEKTSANPLSSPTGTNNIAQGKAVGRNPGCTVQNDPLSEGEQQPYVDMENNGAIRDRSCSLVAEDSPPILHSQFSTLNCPLGRQPDEPLCPERFTREDLYRIKRQLGTYSFSALYQQRPTPPEGGLFKREWFKRIVDRAPEGLRWYRGYDLAISTRSTADYTASFRCALDRRTGELYIADGFRKRIEYPEQRRFIIHCLQTERATVHGIESALHGLAFIQEIRRVSQYARFALRAVRPEADKFTRALAWAARAEEGKVILVRGPGPTYPTAANRFGIHNIPRRLDGLGHESFTGLRRNPGVYTMGQNRRPDTNCNSSDQHTSDNPVNIPHRDWIEDFLEEICSFPNSPHDDQLDAVSTAIQMMEGQRRIVRAF